MSAFTRTWHGLGPAFALATKDLKIAWSYRFSFIFGHVDVFGALILFYFVSRVVGDSAVVGNPEDYFQFVVMGMVLTGLIETSVSAAVGAARSDQVQGTLEAVASLPLSSAALGFSWVVFPLVDATIGAVVTVIIALPLGLLGAEPNWPAVIVVMLLSIALFASFGLLGAALVIAFQQGAGAIAFALGILGLLSGTLFPVEVMPVWLETITLASPLRHALDGLRAAALDGGSIADIRDQLLVLLGFLAFFGPVGIASLEVAMRHARKTGGLSRF